MAHALVGIAQRVPDRSAGAEDQQVGLPFVLRADARLPAAASASGFEQERPAGRELVGEYLGGQGDGPRLRSCTPIGLSEP